MHQFSFGLELFVQMTRFKEWGFPDSFILVLHHVYTLFLNNSKFSTCFAVDSANNSFIFAASLSLWHFHETFLLGIQIWRSREYWICDSNSSCISFSKWLWEEWEIHWWDAFLHMFIWCIPCIVYAVSWHWNSVCRIWMLTSNECMPILRTKLKKLHALILTYIIYS